MTIDPPPTLRLRRTLVVLGTLAATWSLLVSLAGGVLLHLGSIRISSRNPVNPLIVALLCWAAAWALSPRGRRTRTLAEDWMWLSARVPPPAVRRSLAWLRAWLPGEPADASIVAGLLVVAVVALGIGRGALVAGGSDSYGYVSHAQLWAGGSLRVEPPLMIEMSDVVPREAFAPLGYRLAPEGTSIVPTYSPGLPMLMSVFQRLGGRDAVFYAVPLLGGLAIWATYLLGRHVGGAAVGLSAAVLLAASPAFLSQLMAAPMSDLPSTAWWVLALACLPLASRRAALGVGLAVGAAILTRPNLAPLAIVPGVLLAWRAIDRSSGVNRIPAVQRALLFAAGAVPACVTVGLLNTYWYGSPMTSGYGSLSAYFRREHLWPNLAHYSQWLLETQTPLVCLAVAAPLLFRRGAALERHHDRTMMLVSWCFVVAVFACYAFYAPFEGWWNLRFVLPAYPALLVLMSLAIFRVSARLPRELERVAPAVLVALVTVYGLAFARTQLAFDTDGEWRYATAGQYVAQRLPERAVLLAMQHSGSAGYYSGRPTIRWDVIPAAQLDPVVAALEERGYHPYFLLEGWEEEVVRAQHQGAHALMALDRPPLAVVEPGSVRIYDLSKGQINP